MTEKFKSFYIDHVPHQQNAHADAFASLAASLPLPAGAMEKVLIYSYNLYCPKFTFEESQTPRGDLQVKEVLETSTGPELRDWRFSCIDFVLYGTLPDDPKEAAAIRREAPRFYYNAITHMLCCRLSDGILLRCLSYKKAQKALRKAQTVCAELTNSVLAQKVTLSICLEF